MRSIPMGMRLNANTCIFSLRQNGATMCGIFLSHLSMTADTAKKSGVLHSPAGPLLWTLLFLALFLGSYAILGHSSLVIESEAVRTFFSKYAIYVGPALALLVLIVLYLLAGIKRLIGLRKFRILNPCIILAVMVPLLIFGYQLQFREHRYTDIARGIIGYFAQPLLVSAGVVSCFALLWFLWILIRRR